MPRTKGSKNRPKINTTNDYASQIAEKQSVIQTLHISVQERRLYGVLATLSRSKATQPYIQEPKFHLHEQIGPPCRNV